MNDPTPAPAIDLGRRLTEDVLTPMKGVFVGKDEIIDLLGVCLIAGENLFLHGPPGTAKSAVYPGARGTPRGASLRLPADPFHRAKRAVLAV